MKRPIALLATLSASGAACAAPPAQPAMTFLAAPAIPLHTGTAPSVVHSRHGDRMVVVVRAPAACGQRLSRPGVLLEHGTVRLSYRAPEDGERNCIATAVFALHGLPSGEIEVVAAAEPPPTVGVALAPH